MRVVVLALVLCSLLLGVNSNWPIAIMAAGADVDISSVSASLPILTSKAGTSSSISTSSSNSASVATGARQISLTLPRVNVVKPLVVSGSLFLSYHVMLRGIDAFIHVIDKVKAYLDQRKVNRMNRKSRNKDTDLSDDPLAGYDYSQDDPTYNAHDDLYPVYDSLPENDVVAPPLAKASSSSSSSRERTVTDNERDGLPKSSRPETIKEVRPNIEKLAKDQEELWRVVHSVFSGHTEKINALVSSTDNERLLVAERVEKAVSKVERIALNLSKRIEALEALGGGRDADNDRDSVDTLIEEVRRETKRDLAKVTQAIDNAKLENDRLLKSHEERLIQKLRQTVDEVKELIKTSNTSKQLKKKSLK